MSVSSVSYDPVKRRMNPVIKPKTIEKIKDTTTAANCKPPCLTGFELNAGVLPFLPPQNIALKVPPRNAITIPSIGYPQLCIGSAYRSYT